MGDKPWKRHERDTAEFFGTARALHGLDRDRGEVATDVFVDVDKWLSSAPVPNAALIVECKFSDKDSSSNKSWPCFMLDEISKESHLERLKIRPLIVLRDGWIWIRLEDFPELFWLLHKPKQLLDNPFWRNYEVRHVNKEICEFFDAAMGQACAAKLPLNSLGKPYDSRYHVVSVGTNARVTKAIGISPEVFHTVNTPV